MKTCNICKKEKEFSEFYKEKRNVISGLRGDCKDCCKKRVSANIYLFLRKIRRLIRGILQNKESRPLERVQ
jgi:hypothetical protein